MPVIVECPCGKRFRAKEELAGKTISCPACGNPLTIPAPQASAPVASPALAPASSLRVPGGSAGPTVYPGYARSGGVPRQNQSPRVAMSRRTAIYLSLFIIVPIVFFIVRMGPVKAMSQWKEASLWVKSDITDIINRFMIKTKEELGYGMSSIQTTPEVKILDLDEPILMWSFPSQVAFQGDSTEGKFHGIYYTRTHRVVGTVDVKGKTYNVKATTSNGHVTFEP